MIININPSLPFYILTISTVAGATVVAKKNVRTHTVIADDNGVAVFNRLMKGIWIITATYGGVSESATIELDSEKSQTISINMIPVFTYSTLTGNKGYEIVNDDDVAIDTTTGNWKIRFLESGILTFSKLSSAINGIDVFCCGGGGGGTAFRHTDADGGGEPGRGGGGGYTTTERGISISANIDYPITVGAGGIGNVYLYSSAVQAGSSEAFGVIAKGGYSGNMGNGGDGGSGGGACDRLGGEDGKDGQNWNDGYKGGKGQGTTTREFGEPTGNLYSTGGHGGATWGSPNWGLAGNGGCGAWSNQAKGSNGGSGIVIIRNKR